MNVNVRRLFIGEIHLLIPSLLLIQTGIGVEHFAAISKVMVDTFDFSSLAEPSKYLSLKNSIGRRVENVTLWKTYIIHLSHVHSFHS